MKLEQRVIDMILGADAKALATNGDTGVHVVPVSTVMVMNDSIWLMNYFLGQTLRNIQTNPLISLVCWKGLAGYQIKGEVTYETSGSNFEQANTYITKNVPNRVLNGLLIISPMSVLDVTPTKTTAGVQIQ